MKSDIDPRFTTSLDPKTESKNSRIRFLAAHIDDNVTDDEMNQIMNFIDKIKKEHNQD